jgi:hypothetical protein
VRCSGRVRPHSQLSCAPHDATDFDLITGLLERPATLHVAGRAGTGRSETAEHQRSTTVPQYGKVGLIHGTRKAMTHVFSLVTALIVRAPEGTRTPNLLIRSPNRAYAPTVSNESVRAFRFTAVRAVRCRVVMAGRRLGHVEGPPIKVKAGRQPVRMPVRSAPCTSGAEHPSTIGAPSRWVMAFVSPSPGRW